jgi:hypothetical protein
MVDWLGWKWAVEMVGLLEEYLVVTKDDWMEL